MVYKFHQKIDVLQIFVSLPRSRFLHSTSQISSEDMYLTYVKNNLQLLQSNNFQTLETFLNYRDIRILIEKQKTKTSESSVHFDLNYEKNFIFIIVNILNKFLS